MDYPAHIRKNPNGEADDQSVAEHCRSTAEYASQASIPALKNTAYLAGLLHDMGKYTDAFSEYIRKAFEDKDSVRRGSVNHSFCGVQFVMNRWYDFDKQSFGNITCELICFVIGSHHGLFDCIAPDGADGFQHRITKTDIGAEEATCHFLSECAGYDELDSLFEKAEQEVTSICRACEKMITDEVTFRFSLSLLSRLLLSAVVEGDRRDTAEFHMNAKIPDMSVEDDSIWQNALATVEKKLVNFPSETPIDKARQKISDLCKDCDKLGDGIYRLSVPTGGGKTLASLRYALSSAAKNHKKRIFFVIPLLSVLEQNAKVIRDFVGDDSLVLEHHSNLIKEITNEDIKSTNELLTETWSAPIIVTTLVQLLNTLFLGKMSSVRRMHSLAESIIVIDEVQSVPPKMLSLFNSAMNFLAGVCGATIILCSATQPSLQSTPRPIEYSPPETMVPYEPEIWEIFKRTEIFDRRTPSGYTEEELAEFAVSCMINEGSALVICNTKAQARNVFKTIRAAENSNVFHLSTAMCTEHRFQTLEEIQKSLDAKEPTICVSSQLIEAGVDLSFGSVIRVLAGLDNVIQSAGRCNRSGEKGKLSPVYLVNMRGENLSFLKEIQQAQDAMISTLLTASQQDIELTSDAAIDTYYRSLYTNMAGSAQDYPLPKLGTNLYNLLSSNSSSYDHMKPKKPYMINQAFKTAGTNFAVFDDNTIDVLVPFGEGKELIAEFTSKTSLNSFVHEDFSYQKSLLAKAKPYTVSIFEYERKILEDNGGLEALWGDSVFAVRPMFYSEKTGLCVDGTAQTSGGDSFI